MFLNIDKMFIKILEFIVNLLFDLYYGMWKVLYYVLNIFYYCCCCGCCCLFLFDNEKKKDLKDKVLENISSDNSILTISTENSPEKENNDIKIDISSFNEPNNISIDITTLDTSMSSFIIVDNSKINQDGIYLIFIK